jgi:hypothetical protein
LSTEEDVLDGKVYLDPNNNLVIENFEKVRSIEITNMQGQSVRTISEISSGTMTLDDLETGIYLFLIQSEKGVLVERFQVN